MKTADLVIPTESPDGAIWSVDVEPDSVTTSTIDTYDLTGSSVTFTPPEITAGVDRYSFLTAVASPSAWVRIGVRIDVDPYALVMSFAHDGQTDDYTQDYNPAVQAAWRIREAFSFLYFETSADGNYWDTPWVVKHDLDLTAVTVVLSEGYGGV
jgi:hypothetical protein